MVGRDALLQRMVHVLLRRTKNNVLLLGDPGMVSRPGQGRAQLTHPSHLKRDLLQMSELLQEWEKRQSQKG